VVELSRRTYQSPVRKELAIETRRSIFEAARELFLRLGYEGTTIEAIATAARRAPQTVTAIFADKRGLFAELLKERAFGTDYETLIRKVRQASSGTQRMHLVAGIAAQIYASTGAEFCLLYAAIALSPELAEVERQIGRQRREKLVIVAEQLARAGQLRDGISVTEAADVFWALTAYEVYRMLVIECRWSTRKYAS
jgi:AcrR family transcriptional regulator